MNLYHTYILQYSLEPQNILIRIRHIHAELLNRSSTQSVVLKGTGLLEDGLGYSRFVFSILFYGRLFFFEFSLRSFFR